MNRILIVEDDIVISELIHEFLSLNPNYQILCTYDGLSAIEAIGNFHPDLIILDGNLPKLNGDKLAAQLKANPLTAQIPLLAISGEPLHSIVGTSLRSLCDASISKPFKLFELHHQIEQLLKTGSFLAVRLKLAHPQIDS